jgi:hypothetical protein
MAVTAWPPTSTPTTTSAWRGNNGAGQAQAYGARIRAAAEAYARVTAGKQHVIP